MITRDAERGDMRCACHRARCLVHSCLMHHPQDKAAGLLTAARHAPSEPRPAAWPAAEAGAWLGDRRTSDGLMVGGGPDLGRRRGKFKSSRRRGMLRSLAAKGLR
ncbi:MAG: hypothetical protein MZV49_22445 [Rhodopseudomonas palustris]|nr:hypothetical protein [Rhodopseudomonas palustris]